MHSGKAYKFSEFLLWTRRNIYKTLIIGVIPVVLYQIAGLKWLAIPWTIYEAIDKRINELAGKTNSNCKYVVLVGAILINSDSDMGSFTEVRRFDVIDLATKSRQNKLNYLRQ